mgnify:CR=1 FL=1
MLSKKRNGWLWVVMLFAVCAVVYGMLSSYPRELAVYSDELRYLDVARSLLQGRGLRVRNMPSDYQKILYPLCILPALLLKTTAAQIKAMKSVSSTLKLVYSQYRELQSFAQFGSDLDANTKATLAQGERIVEVLKQHNSSPVEVIHQVAILYAVTKGFLKEVPVEKISEYEAFLYETLDARYAGLLAAIRTAGKLEKETEQQLASAIAETVSAFLATL